MQTPARLAVVAGGLGAVFAAAVGAGAAVGPIGAPEAHPPAAEAELTSSVSRDGRPVTDLQPHLGAYGHLVALRDGDLEHLHVHPVAFTVPTPGSAAPDEPAGHGHGG